MQEFIKNILEKAETDLRGAKKELAEYAEENYGIILKRNKSTENMISDLEEEIKLLQTNEQEVEQETEQEVEQESSLEEQDEENTYNNDNVESVNQEEPTEVVTQDEEVVTQDTEEITTEATEELDIYTFNTYLTVPYWITDWILKEADWKNKKCPWKGSDKFMNTIKYWIEKDGQIQVRETRNSRFINLD